MSSLTPSTLWKHAEKKDIFYSFAALLSASRTIASEIFCPTTSKKNYALGKFWGFFCKKPHLKSFIRSEVVWKQTHKQTNKQTDFILLIYMSLALRAS